MDAMLVCSGCSRNDPEIAIANLFGTYEMRTTGQLDSVEIKRDGLYRHTAVSGGRESSEEGPWIADRSDGS